MIHWHDGVYELIRNGDVGFRNLNVDFGEKLRNLEKLMVKKKKSGKNNKSREKSCWTIGILL